MALRLVIAVLPAAMGLLLPDGGRTLLNRRGLLQAAGGATLVGGSRAAFADVESQILEYDDEGKLISKYEEQTQLRRLREGRASVEVSSAWRGRDDGSYEDPTLGSCASGIVMRASPTVVADTAALGKPERLDLIKTFGLESELARADLVAASKRASGGVTFYDYDLALPPKTCGTEMASACLPVKVVLLSCGVQAGELHVVRVDATADQWKRSGGALRLLRSSFRVDAVAGEA